MAGIAIQRIIKMLALIPRHPGRISVTLLRERLSESGFKVSARTIQRDLSDLSVVLPLSYLEEDGRRYRWSWIEGSQWEGTPSMDPVLALVILIVRDFFSGILPTTLSLAIERQCCQAKRVLRAQKNNITGNLSKRISIVSAEEIAPKISSLLDSLGAGRWAMRKKGDSTDIVISPASIEYRNTLNSAVLKYTCAKTGNTEVISIGDIEAVSEV